MPARVDARDLAERRHVAAVGLRRLDNKPGVLDDGGGARNQCTGSAGIRAGTTCAGVTPHAKP